jgi:hypothetical protein
MRRLDPPRAQRRRPAHVQPAPSPLGNFLSLGAPRPVDGRPREAGFLARGLKSLHHLPGLRESSGFRCKAHRLQLRGQSGLIHPSSLKSPCRGTYRVWVRCRKILRRSTRKGPVCIICSRLGVTVQLITGTAPLAAYSDQHARFIHSHSRFLFVLGLSRRDGPRASGYGLSVCGAGPIDGDFRGHHPPKSRATRRNGPQTRRYHRQLASIKDQPRNGSRCDDPMRTLQICHHHLFRRLGQDAQPEQRAGDSERYGSSESRDSHLENH